MTIVKPIQDYLPPVNESLALWIDAGHNSGSIKTNLMCILVDVLLWTARAFSPDANGIARAQPARSLSSRTNQSTPDCMPVGDWWGYQ